MGTHRLGLDRLTLRGRGLLLGGLAMSTFGWVTAIDDVIRVGASLVLLPCISAAVVSRTRPEVSCTRTVSPRRVPSGHSARVELHVTNTGRTPTPALLAQDCVPGAMGQGPRFTFARVEPGGSRSAAYTLPAAGRGRYRIGPLSLRVRDAFGLAEQLTQAGPLTELVVTPQMVDLPPILLGGAFSTGSSSGRRSLAAHGEDDIGTRPWRDGDDLRRVHWRTTARTGELSVRREESPWSASATVLIDTRTTAHSGDGPSSSFEWAVSAAASVCRHLGERGLPFRLTTSGGRVVDPAMTTTAIAGAGAGAAAAVIDELATLTTERGNGLAGAARGALTRGIGGVIVAVCGGLTPDDTGVLLASRGQSQGVAVLLDVATWTGSRPRIHDLEHSPIQTTSELLTAGGWSVIVARRGDNLDTLWATGGASTSQYTWATS